MDDQEIATAAPDTLPYAEVTEQGYAETAATTFVARRVGPAVVLTGPCPRCQDPITCSLVDEVFRRGDPRAPARPAEPPPRDAKPPYRTVLCTCAVAHPYRPEGRIGCGAYWTLVLEVEP